MDNAIEIFDLLIINGANIRPVNDPFYYLEMAIACNHVDILAKFISWGFELNNEGAHRLTKSCFLKSYFCITYRSYQDTPLGIAYCEGNWESIEMLIANGARDVLAPHYAVVRDRSDHLAQFLALGYDINFQDPNGKTPLHLAYKKGNLPLAQMLLDAGADPNIIDNKGRKPGRHPE